MNKTSFNHQLGDLRPHLSQFAFKSTQKGDDADDLVQDTNMRAWLFTIMKNTFINNYHSMVRKKAIVHTCEDDQCVR
jgi:DNA-directed RNA polymerase specialized sigma24 family protein